MPGDALRRRSHTATATKWGIFNRPIWEITSATDTKRLEQGGFVWPSITTKGRIALTASQLAALLDGCEWRVPVPRRRPELAG